MKMLLTLSVLCCAALTAIAGENDYRAELQRMHDRFSQLEVELHDYRKPRKELAPELEKERLLLLGQLTEADPIWALANSIQADVEALTAGRDRTDPDLLKTLEPLKTFLAHISLAMDAPTSKEQAAEYASALRVLLFRRDVAGVRAWSEKHIK